MKLVFATNNPHKLREIQHVLGENFELTGLKALGCHEDIPEEQDTLEGNAAQKAFYVYEKYGENCFADDTGLEVESLGGAPGVFSARYAGEDKNPENNIQKLLKALQGKENRKARFRTVISLVIEGKETQFEGIVEGTILHQQQGTEGFGYDPVFQPQGYKLSFAQMPLSQKNTISHRARAFRKLIEFLQKKYLAQ